MGQGSACAGRVLLLGSQRAPPLEPVPAAPAVPQLPARPLAPAEYLPIGGHRQFCEDSVRLAYGDDSPVIKGKQVAMLQSLSGTGSCRLMAGERRAGMAVLCGGWGTESGGRRCHHRAMARL